MLPGRVTMGLPRLLVVGPRGEEMHWLPCDHESAVVLKEWDFVASQWLPAQRPYTHAEHLYACSHAGDPSILAKNPRQKQMP